MKITLEKDGEFKRVWRVDSYWLAALGWKTDKTVTYTEKENQAVEDHKAVNATKAAGLAPKPFVQMTVNELVAYTKAKELEITYVAKEGADSFRTRIVELEKK